MESGESGKRRGEESYPPSKRAKKKKIGRQKKKKKYTQNIVRNETNVFVVLTQKTITYLRIGGFFILFLFTTYIKRVYDTFLKIFEDFDFKQIPV